MHEPAKTPGDRPHPRKVVLLVASDELGRGSTELGRILIRSFLKTLREVAPKPQHAIFLNSGVRLTTEGSDLLCDLAALQEAGVDIASCGTCLDYFHLKDRLKVGRPTNMREIATTLLTADQILRP